MKYKVFYVDTEVAEFETLKECEEYVNEMLNIDRKIKEEHFIIYCKEGE